MPKRDLQADIPIDLRAALTGAPSVGSGEAASDKSGPASQGARGAGPNGAAGPLSVLLADDNRMFREALLARIRQVVGDVDIREVYNADELFVTCGARPDHTDLFLVDMGLPGLQGGAGLRELRRLRPDAMVIAINCSADPTEARKALEIGVSAYLLRSMGSVAFSAALALVMNGERFFPASIMLEALKLAGGAAHAGGPPRHMEPAHSNGGENLTPRQLSVLRHLAAGKSNKEIARALGIQEITVKVHLQAIFARIGVSNRTQAAMHAERAGWFAGVEELESGDGSDDGKSYDG
ncbi:MAG: LuxR C-terminal-related transcriptional regulator [Reyranellaceae bacterium]